MSSFMDFLSKQYYFIILIYKLYIRLSKKLPAIKLILRMTHSLGKLYVDIKINSK